MEEPVAGYNNTTNNIYKSQEAPRDDERYIFWLCGWAGAGKSTIARTVAREYASKGGLGASFFSRGKGDVHDASMFVTSIAVQLAQSSKALRDLIYEAILSKPGIVSKTLRRPVAKAHP